MNKFTILQFDVIQNIMNNVGTNIFCLGLIAVLFSTQALGQDTNGSAPPAAIPAGDSTSIVKSNPPNPFSKDEIDSAVDRGLDYLLSQQKPDGSITDKSNATAMTSLAIMALASTGVTASQTDLRGEALYKALQYVLTDERQEKNGYFGNRDGSRMYGHGITTLMLTEMIGMGRDDIQDERIHHSCQRAISLILSAQAESKDPANRGGWRYTPNSPDSDLSISVWQVMALRSAKNDGLEVPNEAIEKAIQYLKRSYSSRLDADGNPVESRGGFCYTPDQRNATFAMTAAGLLAMQVCGQYESPLVKGAADWLIEKPPRIQDRFFLYGTYYYAQGMHQCGGEYAKESEKIVRELLLQLQNPNGSWTAKDGEEAGAGQVYATSMAILSLSVKYHYLPIYQR